MIPFNSTSQFNIGVYIKDNSDRFLYFSWICNFIFGLINVHIDPNNTTLYLQVIIWEYDLEYEIFMASNDYLESPAGHIAAYLMFLALFQNSFMLLYARDDADFGLSIFQYPILCFPFSFEILYLSP